MYPMSSRNWAGNSRCRLNVQLLMYPGLPAPGFIYSIVPPFARDGSTFGRVAVTAGSPLSRRSAETRPEVTCGKFCVKEKPVENRPDWRPTLVALVGE